MSAIIYCGVAMLVWVLIFTAWLEQDYKTQILWLVLVLVWPITLPIGFVVWVWK